MGTSNIPVKSWESIIDEAAANMWVPKERAREVAAAMLGELRGKLLAKNRIKLKGFGTFSAYRQKSYYGRNPRTQAPILVPARWQYRFRLTTAIETRLKSEGPFT